MKAILLFLSFTGLLAPSYARQDREADYYAIVEAVIKKENAAAISISVSNGSLLMATDSLRNVAADTMINFESAARQNFIGQLANSKLTQWGKKKIYHAKVLDSDLVREITSSAVDGKIAAAFQPMKDRTLKIHRMSLPLFFDSGAIAFIEYERLTVVNDVIVLRDGYRRTYFLAPDKKAGRWKVTNIVSTNM